jgi:hypothetical protein
MERLPHSQPWCRADRPVMYSPASRSVISVRPPGSEIVVSNFEQPGLPRRDLIGLVTLGFEEGAHVAHERSGDLWR